MPNYKCAVVVPTFDRSHLFSQVVESIPKWCDLIVVYSRDEDLTYIHNIDRQKYTVLFAEPQGAGLAKAVGGKYAVDNLYDYIVFLDDDCKLDPGLIRKFCRALANPDVGVVGCGTRWMETGKFSNSVEWHVVNLIGNVWATTRTSWLLVGGIDGTMEVCEDYDYQVRLRLLGKLVTFNVNFNFKMLDGQERGGLERLGVWRGKERVSKGRLLGAKRMGSKFPGLVFLGDYFEENPAVFQDIEQKIRDNIFYIDREGIHAN